MEQRIEFLNARDQFYGRGNYEGDHTQWKQGLARLWNLGVYYKEEDRDKYRTFDQISGLAHDGDVYAASLCARLSFNCVYYRNIAADNDDRIGLYLRGIDYLQNYDHVSAIAYFKRSAELGYGGAMVSYARLAFSPNNPEHVKWLCKAAEHHNQWALTTYIEKCWKLYKANNSVDLIRPLYVCGRFLDTNAPPQCTTLRATFTWLDTRRFLREFVHGPL